MAFPRLIIMITHDDIDFGIRQLESLGLSLCLSRPTELIAKPILSTLTKLDKASGTANNYSRSHITPVAKPGTGPTEGGWCRLDKDHN